MGSHQTGKKKANRLGLFDMSGNVSEWCYDLYNAKVSVETVTDPLGAMSGDYHVIRGGNWQSLASETSVCFRDDYAPLTDAGKLWACAWFVPALKTKGQF